MLYWIVLVATVVCVLTVIVMKVKGFDFDDHFGVMMISGGVIAALVITAIIMTCMVADAKTNQDAYAPAMEQRYESLTYQLQNDMYNNENEYGKKALFDQIQTWNEDLASHKKLQDNPFTGIFHYHVYDRFDFIKLPERGVNYGFSKTGT